MKQSLGENDTICAIATAQGEAGIGIVRVSGKNARALVAPLYRGNTPWASHKSHSAYFGEIIDPVDDLIIDEALFLPMLAPKSYTGEDVIEIQAHGNPLLLEKIISSLLAQGTRLATPGEFTRRAFLNGRIDLAQAEAIMEIISAKSAIHHQWALNQLKGLLSQKISSLKERLISIIAQIEASIDFSEEELPLSSNQEILEQLNAVLQSVQTMLTDYSRGRQIREGFTVVIAGRPNVGKSSLMNYFLQEDRAIVTSVAGTTRDLLQEPINLEGISIKLVDTAGYRHVDHPIEKEGILRAEAAREKADLILFMIDTSQALTEEDIRLAKELSASPTIVVLNKIDLPARTGKEAILKIHTFEQLLPISIKNEVGLAPLQVGIKKALLRGPEREQPLIALLRHRNALIDTKNALNSAVDSIKKNLSWEFPAIDLRDAIDALGKITGETTLDHILDEIFDQFCIGK